MTSKTKTKTKLDETSPYYCELCKTQEPVVLSTEVRCPKNHLLRK